MDSSILTARDKHATESNCCIHISPFYKCFKNEWLRNDIIYEENIFQNKLNYGFLTIKVLLAAHMQRETDRSN